MEGLLSNHGLVIQGLLTLLMQQPRRQSGSQQGGQKVQSIRVSRGG